MRDERGGFVGRYAADAAEERIVVGWTVPRGDGLSGGTLMREQLLDE
jgi:hypothetical protein